MLLTICVLAVVGLAVAALTRRRVLVICGFYCFYALLTVLDQGDVPQIAGITVYRAMYVVLAISLLARAIQDRALFSKLRPLPWLWFSLCVLLLLAASLYSPSPEAFLFDSPWSVWSRIVFAALFVVTAAHIQQGSDLKFISYTVVAVSLTLSAWVIWSAAQFDFEAYRGGIEVNQNYVSLFVVSGALPLIHALFTAPKRWVKVLSLLLLPAIALATLILASRGLIAAFAAATVALLAGIFRRRWRTFLVVLGVVVAGFALTILLPGGENFLRRFSEGDLGTLDERTILWTQAFRHFSDSGLIGMFFGQGLSSERMVLGTVTGEMFNYHNEYLRWLMDTGIVGLSAFLALLYSVGRGLARLEHPLKYVMVGWFTLLLVTGLTATISEEHVFWILLGAIAGVTALERHPVGRAAVSAAAIQPAPPATLPGTATV
jgi:O-antigen ligase